MFQLLRLAIWIAGIATLTMFGLRYFGYEPNWQYWNQQKTLCTETFTACRSTVIRKGLEGAQKECQLNCFDPRMFVLKSSSK
ncbi:MAG: hypothetical protein WCL23_04960 [Candidatus Moraniibacteriota bacterium]